MSYQRQVGRYAQNMRNGETVRETEAKALLSCANKMAEAQKQGYRQLAQAAQLNQRLWMTFAAAIIEGQTDLPDHLKARISSLAIFVHKQTMVVIRSSKDLSQADILIKINRELATGLSVKVVPQAGQQPTATPTPRTATASPSANQMPAMEPPPGMAIRSTSV